MNKDDADIGSSCYKINARDFFTPTQVKLEYIFLIPIFRCFLFKERPIFLYIMIVLVYC